jgi:hypothetical protein
MTIQDQIKKQIKESEEETKEFVLRQVSEDLLLLNALDKQKRITLEVLE